MTIKLIWGIGVITNILAVILAVCSNQIDWLTYINAIGIPICLLAYLGEK